MTTTTEVYWTYRGTILNNLAWNIKTRGGSRMGTADPRGEDQLVPGMTGRRYLYKYRDSRIITLGMWVRGADQDGDRPIGAAALAVKFDQNWDTLANLFDVDGQQSLTKRFRDGVGGYKTATALAEYHGGLDADMSDEYKADFSPQLLLADPWFYGAYTAYAGGAVTVDGNRPTDHVILSIAAGATISWQGGARFVTNNSAYTIGVDCRERSVTSSAGYQNGLIVRDRSTADWCTLNPGAETFTGGTVSYAPAWR